MSLDTSKPGLPFDPIDPFSTILDLLKTLDQLLPVRTLFPTRAQNQNLIPVKANSALPTSGSPEEYLTFLSSLREARDAVAQTRSSISRDLHGAHQVVKLHELRLTHATNTLNALEDVIGETRARFRTRGIPIHPPRDNPQNPDSIPAETPSGVSVPPSTSHVEDVSAYIVPARPHD